MKKYIINLSIFGGCFILIFTVINVVMGEINPQDKFINQKYDELFNSTNVADICILGTSKAIYGINPKELESKNNLVYNFGFAGSTPEFTYYWYNNYFKNYYPKPKLIIYEVNWLMFNENWMWRKIEQDSKHLPFKEYFKLFFNSTEKSTVFFNRYSLFNKKAEEVNTKYSVYKGFKSYPNEHKSIKAFSDTIRFNPKRQYRFFKLLIKSFKANNENVIFVMLPEKIDPEFRNNKYFSESLHFIKQEISDFTFLDYHSEIQRDSSFKDWGHLNKIGASIISKKLRFDIDSLTQNKLYK